MKKNVLLFAFFILALAACQQQVEVKSVDSEAEEAAINDLLVQLATSFKEQDVPGIVSLLSEDVLMLGSDPSEIWNKEEITAMWTQLLTQPVELKMTADPVIKLAPDGKSATAVQQYVMPVFSTKIEFRNVYHLIKEDGNWLIFVSTTGCILKNEDLPKIDEVIGE